MGWPALPPEVLWALAAAPALLALGTAIVWQMARQHPDKDYAELKARIRTWWWMVGLFAAALISGRAGAIVFFALVSFLAFREFVTLVPPRPGDDRVVLWAYAAIPLQYVWAYFDWYGVFIIFIPVYTFLALPFRAVLAGQTTGFVHAASTLQWGLMTTTFSISHAAYLLVLTPGASPRVKPHWPSPDAEVVPGLGLVVLLIALTEINDVAQYVWGKSFGRRRIAPRVSPNKTVAGFLGGVGTTIVLAALVGPLLTPMDWRYSLAAGGIIAVAGFAGDLSMSMLKRDLGVKDTGATLPGHGGVLDRVDSLTYSAPLYFHYVYYHFSDARRRAAHTIAIGLITLIAVATPALAAPAERPLNFVVIMADDLGQRDLGCYGSTFYETPNLDRFAQSGMRFTSAYAACPVCSPTRSSFQSGKYPARTRNTDFFGGPQPSEALELPRFNKRKLLPAEYLERLPLEEVTIAEALKEAGYATFFAGKWHLGGRRFLPEQQGYDENQGGNHAGYPKSYFSPYENPQLKDGPPVEHLDLRLASEAARFINDHRDQPFFVCFCPYEVHTPLQTSDELRQKYEAKARERNLPKPHVGREGVSTVRLVQDHAVYAGMVETMDAAVGKVLAALEEAGVADHTAVFFTSDNGGLSTAEGSPTSNLPLRAGKGWMYEGGIRVPLIVRWPGVTKPGAVCDQYMTSTDYYPTMLAMAGIDQHPEQHVDGQSFAPLLHGEREIARGPIFWHYPHYGNQGGQPAAAIRDGDWKLIEFFEDGRTELYNLASDPSEQHDLAKSDPDRTAAMLEQLQTWQKSVGAKFPAPNPKYASTRERAAP